MGSDESLRIAREYLDAIHGKPDPDTIHNPVHVKRLAALLDKVREERGAEVEQLRAILQRIYDNAGYVKEDVWWDIVKELTGEDPPPPDVWDRVWGRYKAMLERLARETRGEE